MMRQNKPDRLVLMSSEIGNVINRPFTQSDISILEIVFIVYLFS
jgi:hypothetical protein